MVARPIGLLVALAVLVVAGCSWTPHPCLVPCTEGEGCPPGYICRIGDGAEQGMCRPGPNLA